MAQNKGSDYSFDNESKLSATLENLKKAASKIDFESLKTIAAVVDTHSKVKSEKRYISSYRDPFHWRKAINEINEKEIYEITSEEQYFSDSFFETKGRFFRAQGMSIDKNHDDYPVLKEVMDYLESDQDSSANIRKICQDQKLEISNKRADFLATNSSFKEEDDDQNQHDMVMFNGQKYKLRDNFREEYAVDTIEEFYIKALAVSILAETDGNSKIAKDILNNGGMLIIKNLQPESVLSLLQDLQVIALEGEGAEKSKDDWRSNFNLDLENDSKFHDEKSLDQNDPRNLKDKDSNENDKGAQR